MVKEVMFKHHPGRDYVKVICDVCGGQFRQKDTIRITDKYNHQYGLVVCKADADEINEQSLPNRHVDKPISQPEILRPERTDSFAVNLNDDRVPGAPRNPFAQVNPINDTIDLFWQGPEDTGSSGIIGYIIQRADPQLSYYDILSANTGTEYTYYQDLTADTSAEYSYKIAAINSFGTGAYSEEFFWPVNRTTWSDLTYLLISPANEALVIDGNPLRMNHTE
jgi:hypothetical protein